MRKIIVEFKFEFDDSEWEDIDKETCDQIIVDDLFVIFEGLCTYSMLKNSPEIRDEMDADLEDSGLAQGEIESCLNHWSNKYLIVRKK